MVATHKRERDTGSPDARPPSAEPAPLDRLVKSGRVATCFFSLCHSHYGFARTVTCKRGRWLM